MTTNLQDLLPGARTAIRQCLAIGPEDRVFIFTDQATKAIGEALQEAAQEQGAAVIGLHLLEEFGPRPFTEVPEALLQALEAFRPTVTIFAAQGQPGEVTFRLKLSRVLRHTYRVRHGHMIGITPEIMQTGMRADYLRVASRTIRVFLRVYKARTIQVQDPYGTDFTVYLDPQGRRWNPSMGLLHYPGDWGNLPDGEVFTAPVTAQGVLVAHLLGDYFSEKYGLLDAPMTFYVEDGRVTRVEHPNPDLAQEVRAYLQQHENSPRVGEFALGTNEFLTRLVGNMLQDEKFPGVHVAFGNPYPDRTGADWSAPTHVDVIPLRVSVWVDGEPLMEEGRYLI